MYYHVMSWWNWLAKLENKMALDLAKLQSEIAAQGTLIAQVQTRVTSLEASAGSSAEQDAVDALAATVQSNNTVLTTLASS